MSSLKRKPQGVLGPEAEGGSCVSIGSGGPGVQPKLFSSFLSPDRKSWMAVSIWGRKVWFIFGSTTWVMILSTPDSSMPDPQKTRRKPGLQSVGAAVFHQADSDLLNHTLPESIPHLILVDGRVPVLCAQVGRDKVVNLLSQVLIGGLSAKTDRKVSEGPAVSCRYSNAKPKTTHYWTCPVLL